jgi:hypothetical protein
MPNSQSEAIRMNRAGAADLGPMTYDISESIVGDFDYTFEVRIQTGTGRYTYIHSSYVTYTLNFICHEEMLQSYWTTIPTITNPHYMNYTLSTRLLRVMYPKKDLLTIEGIDLHDFFTFDFDFPTCGGQTIKSYQNSGLTIPTTSTSRSKLVGLVSNRDAAGNIFPVVQITYGATPTIVPNYVFLEANSDLYNGSTNSMSMTFKMDMCNDFPYKLKTEEVWKFADVVELTPGQTRNLEPDFFNSTYENPVICAGWKYTLYPADWTELWAFPV